MVCYFNDYYIWKINVNNKCLCNVSNGYYNMNVFEMGMDTMKMIKANVTSRNIRL